MFKRIARGWAFAQASWSVLRSHPSLVVFPIFSAVAMLLILGFIAASVWLGGVNGLGPIIAPLLHSKLAAIGFFAILFVFYFVAMFIAIFFNAALAFCSLEAYAGRTPSIGGGIAAAVRRLPQILAWAFVSSTVGVILNILENMLSDALGFLGSLFGGLVEIGWAAGSYFVVPVIVVEGLGPVEAIKRSAAVLRRSWGESAVGVGGFTVISVLFMLPAFLLFSALSGGSGIFFALLPIFIIYALCVSVVFAALSVIFKTGMYVYATTGAAPGGMDPALLEDAFRKKS